MYHSEIADMAAYILRHRPITNLNQAYGHYARSTAHLNRNFPSPEIRYQKFKLTSELSDNLLLKIIIGG